MYVKKEDYRDNCPKKTEQLIKTANFIVEEGNCYNGKEECWCHNCPFGRFGAKDFDCEAYSDEVLVGIAKEYLGYFEEKQEGC